MKLSSPESFEALKGAQVREDQSVAFYEKCRSESQNVGTRSVLDVLIGEERKHYAIVTRLLDEATGNAPVSSIELTDTGSAKSRLEKTFGHRTTEGFRSEKSSVMTMLSKALELEKESFNLYSKAGEAAEDGEVKSIYAYLAGEEGKHYDMIENLRSYLDDPGTWLYEEENLIFRRG